MGWFLAANQTASAVFIDMNGSVKLYDWLITSVLSLLSY